MSSLIKTSYKMLIFSLVSRLVLGRDLKSPKARTLTFKPDKPEPEKLGKLQSPTKPEPELQARGYPKYRFLINFG